MPDTTGMPDSSAVDPASDANVTLREITRETYRDVLFLKVSDAQEQFVASNSNSLAQALFHDEAWFRGIYADDVPVGFVMLEVWTKEGEYARLCRGSRVRRLPSGDASQEDA